MKVRAHRSIVTSDGDIIGMLFKEYDSDLIPCPGMFVQDTMWHDLLVIDQVICNFAQNQYEVVFDDLMLEELPGKNHREILQMHGWEVTP